MVGLAYICLQVIGPSLADFFLSKVFADNASEFNPFYPPKEFGYQVLGVHFAGSS